MSNTDGPRGFWVLQGQDPMIKRCYVDGAIATAIFKGDLVKMVTDSSTSSEYPTVDIMAAASDDYYGVVLAIYDSSGVEINTLAASTAGFVDVATNPKLRLGVQVADDTTALTQAAVGDQADPVFTAGDSSTGQSRFELSANLKGDGQNGQFMILDKIQRPDNTWGANVDVEVVASEHVLQAKFAAV